MYPSKARKAMSTPRHIRTPLAARPADDFADDERLLHLRQRPDGYHWTSADGAESGPYELADDALADMDGAAEDAIEGCESPPVDSWSDTVPAFADLRADAPETDT
ncbi:MAG TPA: hypothetical protein VGE16_07125 [Albitalea sp.]